jgi:hypothetical protein
MGHYAKINNGVVQEVIVAEPEFFTNFVDTSPGEWLQTSYNTIGGIHYDPATKKPSQDQSKALRKNFAGVGFTYDRTRDAFIPPKPFNSWVLNEDSCTWEAPSAYPDDGKSYIWDEQNLVWSLRSIE